MTVSELIEALKEMPQDKEVKIVVTEDITARKTLLIESQILAVRIPDGDVCLYQKMTVLKPLHLCMGIQDRQ